MKILTDKQLKESSEEIFAPIKGFEDYYEISNLGRIYSKPRLSWNGCGYKKEGNKFLKLKENNNGYKYVILHKNNIKYQKYVHRLVAEHFLDNKFNYSQVNHLNGNKSDNRIQNLEWCSVSENILHRYRILEKKKKKIKCLETGNIFLSCKEADEYLNVSKGSVSKVIRGLREHVKNFHFVKIN